MPFQRVDAPSVPAESDRGRGTWRRAGEEPALADVLIDPLVHLVMRRDNVTPAELEGHVMRARALLLQRSCRLCAA